MKFCFLTPSEPKEKGSFTIKFASPSIARCFKVIQEWQLKHKHYLAQGELNDEALCRAITILHSGNLWSRLSQEITNIKILDIINNHENY